MDFLAVAARYLKILSEETWLRNLALLVVVSFIAYLPAWFTARTLRAYRDSKEITRSRGSHLALELAAASFWPLWAILLLYVGFQFWVHLAPRIAGQPFRVFPLLWFFLLYRLLNVLTRELLPPGPFRKKMRKGVIPLVFLLAGLQQLDLLKGIVQGLEHPLLQVGGVGISALSLSVAVIIFAVFLLLARLAERILRSRFLPGLGMDPAASENLATLVRYGLVAVGILAGVDSLGFDLTTLKIALGALGIGIGFGLQNVVNNVVSGFILLIERTVKRGDIIVVGGTDGRVLSIGLRSSVVRTRAGHEIIVPNSDLVTSPVTNFSFSDQLVRVDVPVGVSYGADPNRVRELLLEAAGEEERVLNQPPPDVLFKEYGSSSIDFELRVWINDPWQIPQVRSALYFSVWYKLKGAHIEIPFPQRDLHFRGEEIRLRIDRRREPPVAAKPGGPEN
jgi:small-conductance mechanosensitive channel